MEDGPVRVATMDREHPFVTISLAGQGTTQKVAMVDKVIVKHAHPVVWHVNNDSDQTCNVAVRHFHKPNGPDKDVARGANELQLRPGNNGVIVAWADILDDAERACYTYEVWLALGTDPTAGDWYQANDPEYEIWP